MFSFFKFHLTDFKYAKYFRSSSGFAISSLTFILEYSGKKSRFKFRSN